MVGSDDAQPRMSLSRTGSHRLAIALGLVLALAGCGGSSPSSSADSSASSRPSPSSTPARTAVPSNAGSPIASPTVSAGASLEPSPRASGVATRIRIPRLGIDLPIVEGDGIDAPLDKAAHYPGTAWPGGGSNIYIYGHAREGLFIELWNARRGDEVILEAKDGATWSYEVTEVRPRTPYDAVELLEPTPTEQLTLQTSTSNTATAPRFVVIALPVTP